MAKIRGKFAPLMDELGDDDRFLYQLNDTEKLLYVLILFTIYTTNGTAPDDHRYYKRRYSLAHRYYTVETALAHIKSIYPKLLCSNKKLSLLNSKVYDNRVASVGTPEVEVEVEVEREKEQKDFNLAFEQIWKKYPNKAGKSKAYEKFCRSVKTSSDLKAIHDALNRYLQHLKANTWKQPQDGKTWFNNWRDWIYFQEVKKDGNIDVSKFFEQSI